VWSKWDDLIGYDRRSMALVLRDEPLAKTRGV